MRKIIRKYRLEVFKALAQNLDNIQRNSAKEIIPRETDDGLSPYAMSKVQKAKPGRLTERTGKLLKMLRKMKKWDFKERQYAKSGFRYTAAKTAVSSTNYLRKQVKVTEGFNTKAEQYQAEIRVDVKKGAVYSYNKISRIRGVLKKDTIRMRITKQQMAARFFWQLPGGVRGARRPFMDKAIQGEEFKTVPIIQRKLDQLGSLR